MVLKQCRPRIKSAFNPELWRDHHHHHHHTHTTASSSQHTLKTIKPCLTVTPWTWTCVLLNTARRHTSGHKFNYTCLCVKELSTSVKAMQYDMRAVMPQSAGRKLFFDTHAVVRLLEENGFSPQQAEIIVQVLVNTTHSNMDAIYGDMVTKVQQEIMLQRVMSQISSVKKDMIILEKSEFSALLAENEKVKIQLMQLRVQLTDVMNKIRSDTLLDMNIEKSRVKELRSEHEKRLLETRSDIMEMNSEHDRHLTQTNMKIDTEVAGLKTMLESNKLDTIKYLAGTVRNVAVHIRHYRLESAMTSLKYYVSSVGQSVLV